MRTLYHGQYLGEVTASITTDNLTIKSSNHFKGSTEYHYHSNPYLCILLQGRYLEIDHSGIKQSVSPSQMIYRPSNYVHANEFCNEHTQCLNIEFNSEWLSEQELNNKKPKLQSISHFPFLFQITVDFYKYGLYDFSEEVILSCITHQQKSITPSRKPWLTKLIKIIENDITIPMSLKELAQCVHVHPIYMSRAFKEYTGVTIGEFRIHHKLSIATQQLLSEDINISQIAAQCGFYDEAHFIRTFKSKYAITPHQFRLSIHS